MLSKTIFPVLILVCGVYSASNKRIITSSRLPTDGFPFCPGVLIGKTLYISGYIGITTSGQVVDGIEAQTALALRNIGHILKAAGAGFGDVVKTTVILRDISDFPRMNAVYSQAFTRDQPARLAFSGNLPLDALVQIDAIAVLGDNSESY